MSGLSKITHAQARPLFEAHHAYKGLSATSTYLFGVQERGRVIAAFAWQPPPYGCALAVLPTAPWGVLALSRMVAVPHAERELRHISKPLRKQMKRLIDRTRWPALVTFSDGGLGHTGHVYKCSGWARTFSAKRRQFVDADGRRTSVYSNGKCSREGLTSIGSAELTRWEHHIVPAGEALEWMEGNGWKRVPVPGKTWKSGAQAMRVVKPSSSSQLPLFDDPTDLGECLCHD